MALPVAVQVYSVRDSAEANLADTLKKIKEMGYQGVEFAGLYGLSPEYVIDHFREQQRAGHIGQRGDERCQRSADEQAFVILQQSGKKAAFPSDRRHLSSKQKTRRLPGVKEHRNTL